jgi:hypothetical protein
LAALAALILSACGPLGDEDEPATATAETIAQPTDEVASEGGTDTGASSPEGFAPGTGEGVAPEATETFESTGPDSTPVAFSPGSSGTPATDTVTAGNPPTSESGTPVSAAQGSQTEPVSTLPSYSGSDGTSGATPELTLTESAAEDVVETPPTPGATPGEPFFVREETTPDPAATAVDGDLTTLVPYEVESCSPSEIVPLAGDQTAYFTLSEVNFREGPGADCDTIADEPLAEGVDVVVSSAPVTRVDEEDLVWIQVEVDGEQGWVVIDALARAE